MVCVPVILALEKLRQKDLGFKVIWGCIIRFYLRNTKPTNKTSKKKIGFRVNLRSSNAAILSSKKDAPVYILTNTGCLFSGESHGNWYTISLIMF